ncbi:F-box/FBD/LRR-repeat protein [Tanacetum coccineum]
MKAARFSLDRISSLPPPIIETILCLLPIHDAVRTSVLSKEWRYNWTKIPKLVFDEVEFLRSSDENHVSHMEQTFHKRSERKTMSDKCKFFYAIYQVLLLHQSPILEFTLFMEYAGDGCAEIDQIITHLFKKNTVTKLTLDLHYLYKLPRSIYSLQQLTDLTLMYCGIDHQPPFNGFASLTRLCLMDVDITNLNALHLISSCPVLKCFELHTECSEMFYNDDEGATLPKLLECLHVVEQLTFSRPDCKCASTRASNLISAPKVRLFKVYVFRQILDTFSFSVDEKLSELGENQDSVTLRFQKTREIDSIALEDFSDIWLEHLNECVIGDYRDLRLNLELVKLILAKSPVLKKVKIFLCNEISKDEELKTCKILLSSARASPLVDIIVERVSGCS